MGCFLQLLTSKFSPKMGIKANCCTYVVPKKKAATIFVRNCFIFCVVWAGIEPATQGFSVLCSTTELPHHP